MKSFLIKRTSKVEIGLLDISAKDIDSMNPPKLKLYANALRIFIKNQQLEKPAVVEQPHIIIEGLPIIIKHSPSIKPEEPVVGMSSTGSKIPTKSTIPHVDNAAYVGKKKGKTSKYHYVHFSTKDSCWKSAMKINGISKFIGMFDDEREAGYEVDKFLDSINDTNRPRNRDEFQEINYLNNTKDK